VEIKGLVEAVPQKKMSPAVARQHPDIKAIMDEIGLATTGDIIEVSFVGEGETEAEDARKAATRALALRKKGFTATTRGTSLFVTV
jgi:hypothetical protein